MYICIYVSLFLSISKTICFVSNLCAWGALNYEYCRFLQYCFIAWRGALKTHDVHLKRPGTTLSSGLGHLCNIPHPTAAYHLPQVSKQSDDARPLCS